jgi:hypothetical protein
MTAPVENHWSTFTECPRESPAPTSSLGRDQHGRFLTGNSGGGRKRGARNKLTERFLDAIADDFAECGAEAIAKVRNDDPATYLKIVSSLIPRELIMQREEGPAVDYAELTHEEVVEFIDRRRKQKAVEKLLISVG